MNKSSLHIPLFNALLLLCICSFGQSTNPYHINGNAKQENCNCYTLTPDDFNRSGSVWNIYKINLQQSFDFKFEIFLGDADGNGADGISFVLQPVSTSIGSLGGGLGYEGIKPSIGIVIDTWQNRIDNDPPYDHITIHQNGNINHSSTDNLAGPYSAILNGDNIEDGKWHTFRIIWDANKKKLNAQVDGADRVEVTKDIVKDIFGGDPKVFWGFTGSTGGAKNHQRFCTSLNPLFTIPAGQPTCFPVNLMLKDESRSFGSIIKWFWDFGDGKIDSVQHPAPHAYAKPGNYKVKLQILGNNGCISDTYLQDIVIGSKPVAAFRQQPTLPCENNTIQFFDSSFVQFGTIDKWLWSIGEKNFSKKDPPGENYKPGTFPVSLEVKTKEGCVADPIRQVINVLQVPQIDFTASDACTNVILPLSAINNTAELQVKEWKWNMGNGITRSGTVLSYRYPEKGKYTVSLTAVAMNGCPSMTVNRKIQIYGTKAFAGNDTVIAVNQPLQLIARGGDTYDWIPSAGISNPHDEKPLATLKADARYILIAHSPIGCETSDTINIKVYQGPEFYLPSAFTPNADGKNDRFRPVAVGISVIENFSIYNRYGQQVFSGKNNEGWDGVLNGINQASGTYVWMIKGMDYTGKPHFKKGTVTLIR